METALERLTTLRRQAALNVFDNLVRTGGVRPGEMEVREIFVAGYLAGSGYGFMITTQGGNHVGAVAEAG